MTRRITTAPLVKFVFLLFFVAAMATASRAQTDVEIEIAGPWSYVPDPANSGRVIVVAPAGHTLAVFTGDNVALYSGIAPQPVGLHRVDFATLSCGSTPPPSSFFLYPANGVSGPNIQSAVSSTSIDSVSLPKPCSYESQAESDFKYHGLRPVTTTDPERSFTTSMTLHYKVASAATGAVLDNASTPIPFTSNSGTTKKAISIVLYQDTEPDTACDSHSATAFDATLKLWGLPQVYRVFPQLAYTPGATYNQQIPGSYTPTCPQTPSGSSTAVANDKHTTVKQSHTNAVTAKDQPRSPGRADCHAAQVNVNGVVN
jgi:hypothetical protein